MSSELSSTPGEKAEKPRPARERILDVAGPLFWAEGYRAIGVDRVIAESGVAKATFYKHFPSKDDLMVAWVEAAEAMAEASAPPVRGAAPLTDYARAMIRIARGPVCHGCTWQGSAAEFRDPAHPVHKAAAAVKRRRLVDLQARAEAQGLADPQAAAERVFLLLEGVWAAVRMFGPEAPLAEAEAAVDLLTG
ncbi:MAG: TetR/AcrR family transcriptional regulator [Rhodobacter sp.]|nr:TetR/AcrR family transcriptional regulator [Rhodobacter sp.]